MKNIWITGASSGIGKALALKFANKGWQVAASARREDLLTSDSELRHITILRKLLNEMEDTAAMEWILDKLKDFKTNAEFFESMKRK